MKRLFTAIISLAVMTACFTGCNSDDAANDTSVANTVSQNETPETAASVINPDNTEIIESNVEETNLFEYYSLLDAEYQKSLDTGCFASCIIDNVAYFDAYKMKKTGVADADMGFASYDYNTGKAKIIIPDESTYDYMYCSGKVYCASYKQIHCYDTDGNLIKELPKGLTRDVGLWHVMTDGTAIIRATDKRVFYSVSEDFSTITELPKIIVKGEHNREEELEVKNVIGSIGDTLYVVANDCRLYGINVKTGEQTDFDNISISTQKYAAYIIGDLLFYPTEAAANGTYDPKTIFNLKTGEEIGTAKIGRYAGGNTSYCQTFDANHASYQAPLNDDYFKISENNTIIEEYKRESYITLLDKTRYLYRDSYGMFLREVGTDGEIEIIFE
jgi:hypothetical protein